ncbi:MAG: hypothetical protein JSS32_00705 [Verrucomicrobia bacterium]|nr:hypothetical protein [Verrucomicrobiota bacterium]
MLWSRFAEIIKHPAKFDCLKQPEVLQLEGLQFSPFHLISLLIFIFAILHTLSVHLIHNYARKLEMKQAPKRLAKLRQRSFWIQILYFLSEVEIVFGIWVIPLFISMVAFFGSSIALEYINTRDYTEAVFIVVILALTATRPIVRISEKFISYIARGMGGSLSAWWFTLLTVGPILGSFITEVGSMALSALLLGRQFYQHRPSQKLAYATIALLFVNVSVGGVLTNFASPAVLILAHCWHWTTIDMFLDFGWKAVIGIFISNFLYWLYFRKELAAMNERHKGSGQLFIDPAVESASPIPTWITCVHILFIVWIVATSHYPAIFIASFILFLGFYHSTRMHQYTLHLIRPMMIGLFLAGLVVHGGLQGWWVSKLLEDRSPLGVMGAAMSLTAFNDNAAISYLATLIPDWGEAYHYAIFTGVIAGGGLTVIANAPNPAGYVILRKYFEKGINPIKLFFAALIPTLILYCLFYVFGPLFNF